MAADVEGGRPGQAERAGEGRRQLAQAEGRGLADGDDRARRVGALERATDGLVGHREGVLVEGRGGQGLGAGAPGPAVELLDLLEGGPVTGQVRPVPDDLPHAGYRLIVMPAASRSNVSGVMPSSRSFTFWTRSVGVLGSVSTKRM